MDTGHFFNFNVRLTVLFFSFIAYNVCICFSRFNEVWSFCTTVLNSFTDISSMLLVTFISAMSAFPTSLIIFWWGKEIRER